MFTATIRKSILQGFYLIAALPLSAIISGIWGWLGGFEANIENWQFFVGLLLGHFIMGWVWGRGLGKVTDQTAPNQLAWGAAIAFGVTTTIAANRINHSEVVLNRLLFQTNLPVHILFLYIFMAGIAGVVGITGASLGVAVKDWKMALKLGIAGILTGALTFLIVFLIFDLLGFRVGAPGAAERATMLTVMMVGISTTALVGSGVFGALLASKTR